MTSKNQQNPITLDDLAVMVAGGFEGVNTRLGKLESNMDGFETKLDKLESSMDKLDVRMAGFETKMEKLEESSEGLRSSVNNYLRLSDERYLELKARQNIIANWIKKIADKSGVEINLQELENLK